MSKFTGIKISLGGLIVYVILAALCAATGDSDHAGMFLVGSAIWMASIFVWETQKE